MSMAGTMIDTAAAARNRPSAARRIASFLAKHPAILIGGTGERRTLPLVARYADACNVFDIPDGGATVRHKLAVLQELCAEIGRPYDEIERTIATRYAFASFASSATEA